MTFPDALLAALAIASPAQAETISGAATVIDGDTITINRIHIRLFGMDAPELEQRCANERGEPYNCGSLAADALTEEIGIAPVTCVSQAVDYYGRMVAVCTVFGRDLGEQMVLRGFAVDYPFFSGGTYAAAEREARDARRGLWSGSFDNPRQWRREHRR